ncbi:Uncharacterised protein [Mycobacterium tuberculosis]|nr:Uncharacterised protein [Mycobacterium tuberculosis]
MRSSFSSSDFGFCGKSGTLKPLPCSSLIAATSCGTEALMLGSLMMLVSGSCVSLPSSARLSGTRWSSVSSSGNSARMRAATEMSLASILIPAGSAKARTIGRKA